MSRNVKMLCKDTLQSIIVHEFSSFWCSGQHCCHTDQGLILTLRFLLVSFQVFQFPPTAKNMLVHAHWLDLIDGLCIIFFSMCLVLSRIS